MAFIFFLCWYSWFIPVVSSLNDFFFNMGYFCSGLFLKYNFCGLFCEYLWHGLQWKNISRFWLVIIYWIVNIFALLCIWPTLNKLNNNNKNIRKFKGIGLISRAFYYRWENVQISGKQIQWNRCNHNWEILSLSKLNLSVSCIVLSRNELIAIFCRPSK